LKFEVETEFLSEYPVRQVGDVTHREYWLPAADLAKFNEKIVGTIKIVAEFAGVREERP
jgi:hypothetical protein